MVSSKKITNDRYILENIHSYNQPYVVVKKNFQQNFVCLDFKNKIKKTANKLTKCLS